MVQHESLRIHFQSPLLPDTEFRCALQNTVPVCLPVFVLHLPGLTPSNCHRPRRHGPEEQPYQTVEGAAKHEVQIQALLFVLDNMITDI
jgi:hypothetical protein